MLADWQDLIFENALTFTTMSSLFLYVGVIVTGIRIQHIIATRRRHVTGHSASGIVIKSIRIFINRHQSNRIDVCCVRDINITLLELFRLFTESDDNVHRRSRNWKQRIVGSSRIEYTVGLTTPSCLHRCHLVFT